MPTRHPQQLASLAGNRVRTRLAAGGNRIRTLGTVVNNEQRGRVDYPGRSTRFTFRSLCNGSVDYALSAPTTDA
jgi:hypothetical protein